MKISVTKAVKNARESVVLFRQGRQDRNWVVSSFNGNIWCQSQPKEWAAARNSRTNKIIELAMESLGANPAEAFFAHESTTGRIASRVAQAAKRLGLPMTPYSGL